MRLECGHLCLLLVHDVVALADILSEVLHFLLLHVREHGGVTVHDFVPGLGNCLGLLELTLSGQLTGLLDSIDAEDLVVGILLEVFFVCGDLKTAGYHTNLSGSIQRSEMDLGLEGQASQL
jgi:hypothetical protein